MDRDRACYGAWYEIFLRSEGTTEGKGGTFKDCEARLPVIRDMGFDILYLAPVHPIGETNRKGRNNSLTANPGDPQEVPGPLAADTEAIMPLNMHWGRWRNMSTCYGQSLQR